MRLRLGLRALRNRRIGARKEQQSGNAERAQQETEGSQLWAERYISDGEDKSVSCELPAGDAMALPLLSANRPRSATVEVLRLITVSQRFEKRDDIGFLARVQTQIADGFV